jgi:two-component system chemotaxis response regulator CheY
MAVRVLLVEDSIAIRGVLRRRLELLGCEVVGEASSSEEGLALFRKLSPDLITLDLIMPETSQSDAKDLFRAIRKESPGAVVIIVSARPKSVEAAAFIREGALAYLEKPFISLASLVKPLTRVFPELKLPNMSRFKTKTASDMTGRL